MSAVLAFEVGLKSLTCGECGINFAAPVGWLDKRMAGEGGNRSFWCPNGHQRAFLGETEAQRLQKEVTRLKAEKERAQVTLESVRKMRDHAENQARSLRGVVTRTKNRIGNGVCPCCNKSFQNLRRHMGTKHPDFSKQEEVVP